MCFVNDIHHEPPHFHVLSFSIPEGNLYSFFFEPSTFALLRCSLKIYTTRKVMLLLY